MVFVGGGKKGMGVWGGGGGGVAVGVGVLVGRGVSFNQGAAARFASSAAAVSRSSVTPWTILDLKRQYVNYFVKTELIR